MIISTMTGACGRIDAGGKPAGTAEAVRMIAKAGFDAFDLTITGQAMREPFFTDDRFEYLDGIKKTAKECGIVCNQSHAPYPSLLRDEPRYKEYNDTIYGLLEKAIEDAGYVGAKSIVVHPICHVPYRGNEKYLKDMNMDLYRSLAPTAKKAGIKIALENMFDWDPVRKHIIDTSCEDPYEMCDWFDTLADEEAFTVCLDIGHTVLCRREPDEAIRVIGKRLGALHVHDNDYISDRHAVPFAGIINWDNVCRALAEVDYKGDFTFESDGSLGGVPGELVPAWLGFTHEIGKYLVNKINSFR